MSGGRAKPVLTPQYRATLVAAIKAVGAELSAEELADSIWDAGGDPLKGFATMLGAYEGARRAFNDLVVTLWRLVHGGDPAHEVGINQTVAAVKRVLRERDDARAQLDELKAAVHVFLWQQETWAGGHATEAALRILVPQGYAPLAEDATEVMLNTFAQRHPEDADKLRAVLRVADGGGSPAECREAAGLSLGQAAKVTGLARERIEAIEQGEFATAQEFALLTTAYDVPGWARPEPPR